MNKRELPTPIEEFDAYPTSCGTVVAVRKSDGKHFEFNTHNEMGVYFTTLYNRCGGDESRVVSPKPITVPIT